MPCGCSGGTWKPPEQQQKTDDGKPKEQSVKPAATGPAAPGYYHQPGR